MIKKHTEQYSKAGAGAKEGVCVSDVLREIIDSQTYKSDYEDFTMGLLFVPVGYETVIQSLQKILDSGMWE